MKTNLTFLKSKSNEAKDRAIIVFIPGGPGLSSKTLSGLDILNRSFDLALVDPPGTGGQRDPEKQYFDFVLSSFEFELKVLERPIIIGGHSFGGHQAACLAARKNLNYVGLICLGSPLSESTFNGVTKEYEKLKSPLLEATEKKWNKSKNIENLKNWFSSYEELWFSPNTLDEGRQLILDDKMSLSAFLGVEPNFSGQSQFFNSLKASSIPKLLIAGELDKLVPSDLLEKDAEAGGFDFNILKNAAHFMNLDQSEAVAKLVENKFIDSRTGIFS